MMKKILKSITTSESGATAIEYTLIAALIAIVCITAFNRLGTAMNEKLSKVAETMEDTKTI